MDEKLIDAQGAKALNREFGLRTHASRDVHSHES
jgi:hypothetical protein